MTALLGRDLVDADEIASRLGVTRKTVRRWVNRREFLPVEVFPSGLPREWWDWQRVRTWAALTGRLDATDPEDSS